MPEPKFFPDPLFGWVSCLALVGITAVAAYIDLRRMVIPKWLSLPTLALGFLFNAVRGGWMGWLDYDNQYLARGGWGVGVLDGLLFALAGFGAAFGLFVVLWLLGTCGAGDVKLCAALGAWIGPKWTLYLLIGTMIFLVLLGIGRLFWSLVTAGMGQTKKSFNASEGKKQTGPAGRQGQMVPRKRLVAFSLSVCVATVFVLLWAHKVDLQLSPPSNGAQPHAH